MGMRLSQLAGIGLMLFASCPLAVAAFAPLPGRPIVAACAGCWILAVIVLAVTGLRRRSA